MASIPEALGDHKREPAGSGFLRLLLAGTSVALVSLFFIISPTSLPARQEAAALTSSGAQGGSNSQERSSPPYAARILSLYEGPSDDYEVIGTVGKNAPLEVVGKSDDGGWLAVSVRPAAALYVWVRPWDVVNRPDMSALPVKAPVPVQNPLLSR